MELRFDSMSLHLCYYEITLPSYLLEGGRDPVPRY